MNTVTLPVKGLNFAGCAREIEKHLGKLAPIAHVEASYVSQTVTVTYDETRLDEEQLREMVKDCGFACGAPLTRFTGPSGTVSQPTETEAARAHRTMVLPAMEDRAEASAPAKMDMGIVDHSMMGHDMRDPAMARAMEADMRTRFFVSLVLTIPVILYSPLGTSLFKLHLPTPFGISPNWVLFVLAIPIIWWGGWIFHSGAWRALRNRTLDMNVLVSLGVLVAYFFSVYVTFFAPQIETSYDAAAMLVTFVLFGHWMEMRSRRGSSDALNSLLRLAPSQANVIGPDGEVRTVPVEQVQVDDLLLLRPGEKVPVDGLVTAGVLTFLIWFFVIGQTALFALTLAVTAIVIACPDALGLATPTAVAVGTGIGARNGILIKNATALEQASTIQAIIFAKTGTLTEGKPAVTDLVVFAPGKSMGLDEAKLLQVAATAETDSEHPLASAIVEGAKDQQLAMLPYSQFKAIAGGGVQTVVETRTVLVGTPKLLAENNIQLQPSEKEQLATLQAQGKTVMVVAMDSQAVGLIAVADRIRATSHQAIADLQALGIQVAMLTGDNRRTGESVGRELDIGRVFAEVLPSDKAQYVKKLQSERLFTAMVGDGVNDAPALAQADLGIAIGAGTGVAIETAEVVLMRSDPLDVLAAIRLSKATVTKMKQNLFWAAIYNLIAIPVAAGVLSPFGILLAPEVGALAMSASSLTVATNAVLLKSVERKLKE